jgi:hypothetical protein
MSKQTPKKPADYRVSYVTDMGHELPMRPGSKNLFFQIMATHQEPPKPKRQVKLESGDIYEEEHTPDTLETDEDRAAWAQWEQDATEQQQKKKMALLRFFMLECVVWEEFDLSDEASWVRRQRMVDPDLPIPPVEDQAERVMWYINTVLMTSVRDAQEMVTMGMRMMGDIPEEVLEASQRNFPDPLQGAERLDNDAAG